METQTLNASVYLHLLDRTLLPIEYEAAWLLETIWTLGKDKNFLPCWDFNPG